MLITALIFSSSVAFFLASFLWPVTEAMHAPVSAKLLLGAFLGILNLYFTRYLTLSILTAFSPSQPSSETQRDILPVLKDGASPKD
jgi:hypothetical protein